MADFYQIRLFSRGKVEIFQRVYSHQIGVLENMVQGIVVRYSSSLNTGNCTHSFRPLEGVYDIRVIDQPDYEPTGPHPIDAEVIINGNGKFFRDNTSELKHG
jgi:hypothetical protein